MPLDDKGVPLSEIYNPVLIEEDLKAVKTTRRRDEPSGSRTLKSVADMFYVQDKIKTNKIAKRIIIHGEAGHGKTVFCLKVLDCWSKAKTQNRGKGGEKGGGTVNKQTEGAEGSGNKHVDTQTNRVEDKGFDKGVDFNADEKNLQRCLSLFQLVFYVPLRHAKHGTSSIADLVCGSVPECDQSTEIKIKRILRDGNIKCLVILDGLDEYKVPDTCRVQGFPDSDGLVNCTLLCTMRPWRMVGLTLDNARDKVVQILGLKEDSIKTVIRYVLVDFCQLDEEDVKHFFAKVCHREQMSLIKIPLMLTALCLMWDEEGDVPSREIFVYLKITEMMIRKAEGKHVIVKRFLEEKRKKRTEEKRNKRTEEKQKTYLGEKRENTILDMLESLPLLSEFDYIVDFFEIIRLVGRLALEDLASKEPHLVFPRNKLEGDIGQSEVELALNTGILSQIKEPSLSHQQRVTVSFYHKTIQEFVAALVIASKDPEALSLFRTHCNSVDKVMELSNMIKFVFGLDPMVGCQLSNHVRNVINSDTDIIQQRKKQHFSIDGHDKIKEIYSLQCAWFNEMKHNPSYTKNTDCTTLHVCDVYLRFPKPDDVSVASEMVSMNDNSIVSVDMACIRSPFSSLIQHLPACEHLTSLTLWSCEDEQSNDLLASVLPQLKHLQSVTYLLGRKGGYKPDGTAMVRAVERLPALKFLDIGAFTLADEVVLSPHLEYVSLHNVQPAQLILPSLCQCSQLNYIALHGIELTDTVELTCMERLEKLVLERLEYPHFILSSIHHCSQLTYLVLYWLALTDDFTLPSQLQTLKLNGIESAHFILPSLPGCTHLTTLRVGRLSSTEDCMLLARVLPQLVNLQYIKYLSPEITVDKEDLSLNKTWQELLVNNESDEKIAGHAAVVGALQHLTQLRRIKLMFIGLHDAGTLLLTPHMTQLEKVELEYIVMSPRRWQEFIVSLLKVQHVVRVTLCPKATNIDSDTLKKLHDPKQFVVSEEKRFYKKCKTFHAVHYPVSS